MEQLLKIMSLLRDKEYGCSWDCAQTFSTIAPHTLEEVYEVIEAIEQKDFQHLPNELGDLLFQVVFYAQLGKEAGMFDFDDIVQEISQKLLTRHPHVFPDASVASFGEKNNMTPDQVKVKWEEIKAKERSAKGASVEDQGILADVPQALPAILRAQKLQSRAANAGFDWPELKDVIGKVKEELSELEEAIENNEVKQVKEELGDLLFTVVNLSRHLQLDAEESLRAGNTKFEQRFKKMEAFIIEDKHDFSSLSLKALDDYWGIVKSNE